MNSHYHQHAAMMRPMHHENNAVNDAYNGKSAETGHLRTGELSTGTTIMAVAFEGGVILGAGELL